MPETGQTPAIGIDRVIDENAPTAEVEAVPRRTTRPITESEAAGTRATDGRKTRPLEAEAPLVSETRRSVGRLIAVALLAALLLGVGYFAMEYAMRGRDTASTGAPPGSPRH